MGGRELPARCSGFTGPNGYLIQTGSRANPASARRAKTMAVARTGFAISRILRSRRQTERDQVHSQSSAPVQWPTTRSHSMPTTRSATKSDERSHQAEGREETDGGKEPDQDTVEAAWRFRP